MTGRERRLLRMLCMTASSGGDDGGDKPFNEMTWDQVIASTKTGKYKTFTVGDMKELDLGTEGIVHMQIVGIDVDDLADGSGKAPLTFISKELLKTSHRMNPTLTPTSSPYDEGTGSTGGWGKTEMREYIRSIVLNQLPQIIRDNIRIVVKTQTARNSNTVITTYETEDSVWIPSYSELKQTSTYGQPSYAEVFPDNNSRIKSVPGEANATKWWLRSGQFNENFNSITATGSIGGTAANNDLHFALGFCL